MKKILLPALALLIVLSSCSNLRYSRVPKVKAKKQTVTEAKTRPGKKHAADAKTAFENRYTGIQISKGNTEVVVNEVTGPSVPQKSYKAPAKIKTRLNEKLTQKVLAPIQQSRVEKKFKQTAQNAIPKGSWLWYVVVGLIVAIIGSLLWGIAGQLIVLVGVILILYGLLILLEVV